MPVTMTREEREQFLGGVHVGVLSVASADGAGPLAVPVWYSYLGQPHRRPGRGQDDPRTLADRGLREGLRLKLQGDSRL